MSSSQLPTSPSQLPPHFLDNTYGAEMLSAFAACALWGVHCVQTFMYFNKYPKDPKVMKILVAWIWMLDTVHQGLIITLEYFTLVSRFGDVAPLFEINVEATVQSIFTLFISLPCQCFFLHRIYRLSGNKVILPLFLGLCVLLEAATGLAYFSWALSPNVQPTDILVGIKRSVGITYLTSAAFLDVAIAVCMVFLLRNAKVLGMNQTQRLITRLMVYSVNTGLWTALLAIFCVMAIIAYPTTFIFIGLYMPIAALYCNTLLANLNVRQHLRGMQDVITFSSNGFDDSTTRNTTVNFAPSATSESLAIEMSRSTRVDTDHRDIEAQQDSFAKSKVQFGSGI